MAADLRPHPAMQEVAWVHRPVVVTLGDDQASLRVTNRRSFTDLTDLVGSWVLLTGGEVASSGSLDVGAVPPGSSVEIPLPCAPPEGADVHLTVRWAQRRATAWSPKGHLVAWDQLTLRQPAEPSSPAHAISANPSNRKFGADVASGAMIAPNSGVETGPTLCVFRAPVDNDGFKLMPDLGRRIGVGGDGLRHWMDTGVDRLSADELVEHHHRIAALDDGSQVHSHVVVVPDGLDDLARVGVSFELAPGFDRLRWYGRGPLENYPDRNRGAILDVWEAGIDAPPYLVPQEFGLRTDCRWMEFFDDTGSVVRLDVLDPVALHVSATRFTAHDLYAAGHETDLRPRRSLVVHADVAHRGLGTGSCGPDVLDRYRLKPGTYRFSYRLSITSGV
jgi:beta-galactosidase